MKPSLLANDGIVHNHAGDRLAVLYLLRSVDTVGFGVHRKAVHRMPNLPMQISVPHSP